MQSNGCPLVPSRWPCFQMVLRDGWLCLTCLSQDAAVASAAVRQIYRISLLDPREALRGTILSSVIYLVYTIHRPHFKGQLPDCY